MLTFKIVGLGLMATIAVFAALLIKGVLVLEREIEAEKSQTRET